MRIQFIKVWNIFLIALSALSLFYISKTFIEYYHHLTLTQKAELKALKPSIEKTAKGEFKLMAHFQYEVGEKSFQGKQVLTNYPFKNEAVAKEYYLNFVQGKPVVWHTKARPSYSKLIKIFPIKRFFYSFLMVLLTLYFWAFGRYLVKTHKL